MALTQKQMVEILKNCDPDYDLDEIARAAGWESFFDYTEDEALEEFVDKDLKTTDPNWGGARKGAGMPEGYQVKDPQKKKKNYTAKLRPDQIEWLRSRKKETGVAGGKVLEVLIDKAMADG